ncbi:MAG: McrB family protein [Segatella oris]|uniref:McrB family protein n=1 Tax=Segatella oris TaxID=28135 RepID=UPI003FA31477
MKNRDELHLGDIEKAMNNRLENSSSQVSQITESEYVKDNIDYLSAIRTKPFLLLAGISGTGKSRIVKEMAYASCPDEGDLCKDKTSPGNYCLVEVKPNWNDSTELLGYETILDGGNYHLTKFVKFLIKAMQHENVPFFVCLDEMNLAPVEQYFAEFLSILESRKDVDGTIKSEPLIPAAIFNKYDNKLFKELFPSKEKQEKVTGYPNVDEELAPYSNATYEILREEGLRIPRNLIVVGTVNMDDTTYQFSRKVIDRAMTIEMNEVNLTDMFDTEKPDALSYRKDVVDKGWFFAPFAQSNNALQQMNDERELLAEKIKATIGQTNANGTTTADSLEAILGKTPFRIAYRVVNELILHFYALRMEDKGAEFEELYNKALDNILMMKVLPRIEGNEDLVKEPLAQLATWTEVAYPKANAKIVEMRERLERSHFTSFWP